MSRDRKGVLAQETKSPVSTAQGKGEKQVTEENPLQASPDCKNPMEVVATGAP
jgi:hypothetical protein